MEKANVLAYYGRATFTTVKGFIVKAPERSAKPTNIILGWR